jgi:hypothetical protein
MVRVPPADAWPVAAGSAAAPTAPAEKSANTASPGSSIGPAPRHRKHQDHGQAADASHASHSASRPIPMTCQRLEHAHDAGAWLRAECPTAGQIAPTKCPSGGSHGCRRRGAGLMQDGVRQRHNASVRGVVGGGTKLDTLEAAVAASGPGFRRPRRHGVGRRTSSEPGKALQEGRT